MTRLTLVLVCMAAACVTTPALAQTSSAPRNVLPQHHPRLGRAGVGVDTQGNVYGAVARRQMLERHVKK
jgi:hypothetical protein